MADISITAANVAVGTNPYFRKEYPAGVTITAGQAVYLNASNAWVPADSNASATGNGITDTRGIALNGAAAGQPLSVLIEDADFTPGGALTNGATVYLSTTAGGITHDVPTTGAYPVVLGVAKSTSKMNLRPVASGAVI